MRVLTTLLGVLITVSPALALAQEYVVSSEEAYAGGPEAPVVIFSDQFDPANWYRPQDITFTWELPEDITAVATGISTSSSREPQTAHRPPIAEIVINSSQVTEGVNYLAVQFRNAEKWGQFAVVPIQIDNTSPTDVQMYIKLDEEKTSPTLHFQATDQLSGISHYNVAVNGRPGRMVDLEESRLGYPLDPDATAPYEVNVVAYDKAGNTKSASIVVVPTNRVAELPAGQLGLVPNGPASLLVGLLTSLVLLMLGYLIFERQRYARHLLRLERETGDIHTQLLRIFTALREEIHDQIRSITKKKRLSKGEKEAVNGLNSALSVSEALIEREIKDVKDLLDD